MADTDNLILGNGTLYLNNIDIGYLTGEVQIEFRRKGLTLSPSGSSSTDLIPLIDVVLRAGIAEFSPENLRLALGYGGSIATSVGSLSYDPSSYSFAADQSFDVLTFGRASISGSTLALRFEHEKADGNKVVVIFYTAVSLSDLTLPFSDEKITMLDVAFYGVFDETRLNGDQIGVIFEEK